MAIKVSIIIPVYNVEDHLEQCLDTIVNQTLQGTELIVIDDGSTDGSLEICERYANTYKNFVLIRHAHMGVSNARNTGILTAQGEYLAFVDSDDYVDLDMYAVLYESVKRENLDLAVCKYAMINENNKIRYSGFLGIEGKIINKQEGLYQYFYTHNMTVLPWDKLYKRSVFIDNGIFFPENSSAAVDAWVSFSIFLYCKRIMLLDRTLYFWRTERIGRLTKSTDSKIIKDIFNEYHKVALAGYALDDNLLPQIYKNYFIEDRSIGILDRDHYYFYQKDIFFYCIQTQKHPTLLYGSTEDNEQFMKGIDARKYRIVTFDDENDAPQHLRRLISGGTKIWITSRNEFFRRFVRLYLTGIISGIQDVLPLGGETELESVYSEGYTQYFKDFGLNYFAWDFEQIALKLSDSLEFAKLSKMFDTYMYAGMSNTGFDLKKKNDFCWMMQTALGKIYLQYQRRNFLSANLAGRIDYDAKIAFVGASSLGKEYLHLANMRLKNLVFLDNDMKKNDTFMLGYKIMHPEVFIKQASNYKIIITSMYFTEIARQLLNQGIINDISEIMVFNGQLEAEVLFCNMFQKFL